MKEYISLIRRADFSDLFKYGRLHINQAYSRELKFSADELKNHKEIARDILCHANPFESSIAYIFLLYSRPEDVDSDTEDLVLLENVHHIYPLDIHAKIDMEAVFDSRLNIDAPLWPDILTEFQKKIDFESAKRGINNVWQVFGMETSYVECAKIITDDIIRDVIDNFYSDERLQGEHSLWFYLLRYDRHAFYPKTTIGYFMDAVHVYCNYKAKRMVMEDEVASTNIYKVLANLKDLKFDRIQSFLDKDGNASGFISTVKDVEPNVDYIEAAALYLLCKDKFRDGLTVPDSNFLKYSKRFGKEFEIAVYLLGIFLKYDNTYDCYYDSLALPIFKQKIVISNVRKDNVGAPEMIDRGEGIRTGKDDNFTTDNIANIEVHNDCDTKEYAPHVLPKFPCKMYMLTDKGKPSKAKGAIKTVRNKEEYFKLINSTKKWVEEKTDTGLWN